MSAFMRDNFPKLTPGKLATINSLYPAPTSSLYPNAGRYWRPAADAYGEMRYNCPGIFMSGAYPRVGGVNASWNYHWDVLRPENAMNGLGVTHVMEEGAIWGFAKQPEKALQAMMQAYWTSFIRTRNPNTFKLATAPEWIENYEGGNLKGGNQRIRFVNNIAKVGMEKVDTAQKERCGFWASIGSIIGQ
jgi:carboxylesterase type B